MFDSVATLERSLVDHLDVYRFYSSQSWVAPGLTRDGEKIHDVAVVGAGQSGLALAYNLKLRGVRRLAVIDAQGRDKPGPWSSFARMRQLRTPKAIQGPECSNPLLSFKAWFCSKHSRDAYEAFEFIPLPYWREYLAWYRQVLGIETLNGTSITDIAWDGEDECFRLDARGSAPTHARKVCLATGMAAAGRWAPPDRLAAPLPPHAYLCAWDAIAFEELAGKDVAVIGAGASGFDNASCAVEAGCRSVTVFSRSPFPREDIFFELWRGRDDSDVFPDEDGSPPADILDPLLAHNSALPDDERLALLTALFRHGRSPANPEYLTRASNIDRIEVLEGWPVDATAYDEVSGRVHVQAHGETLAFDRLIFATGSQCAMSCRPELASLSARVLTWADAADGPLVLDLDRHPKLTPAFQLQPRDARDDYVRSVYSLADLVHMTVGLQSLPHVVTSVADHISRSLYKRQHHHNVALVAAASNLSTECIETARA